MAKFLTGNELNAQLENLFELATDYLILISPYIKLHDRYASALKAKKEMHGLKIIVVFGKNEDDFSKSMKQDDFNFFKDFPNIEIRYEKRLHAKYYANENSAILTSMNLYNFSQDNNIEAGVLTNIKSLLESYTSKDTLDDDAYSYFNRVIEQSDLLFRKTPNYESSMLGLSKRYTNSVIEVDKLSEFFINKMKDDNFKKETYLPKPTTSSFAKHQQINQMGFCIRTGVEIPFNQKHPMSNTAFQSWKKFSNLDYPEKYCHFSGELSNGETSFSKPILRKNWVKANEVHKL